MSCKRQLWYLVIWEIQTGRPFLGIASFNPCTLILFSNACLFCTRFLKVDNVRLSTGVNICRCFAQARWSMQGRQLAWFLQVSHVVLFLNSIHHKTNQIIFIIAPSTVNMSSNPEWQRWLAIQHAQIRHTTLPTSYSTQSLLSVIKEQIMWLDRTICSEATASCLLNYVMTNKR